LHLLWNFENYLTSINPSIPHAGQGNSNRFSVEITRICLLHLGHSTTIIPRSSGGEDCESMEWVTRWLTRCIEGVLLTTCSDFVWNEFTLWMLLLSIGFRYRNLRSNAVVTRQIHPLKMRIGICSVRVPWYAIFSRLSSNPSWYTWIMWSRSSKTLISPNTQK
jgi:hypothetical protein